MPKLFFWLVGISVSSRFAARENDQDLIAKIAAASEHDDDDDQVHGCNW